MKSWKSRFGNKFFFLSSNKIEIRKVMHDVWFVHERLSFWVVNYKLQNSLFIELLLFGSELGETSAWNLRVATYITNMSCVMFLQSFSVCRLRSSSPLIALRLVIKKLLFFHFDLQRPSFVKLRRFVHGRIPAIWRLLQLVFLDDVNVGVAALVIYFDETVHLPLHRARRRQLRRDLDLF